ncbi:glycosyltransferase family 4 protein [Aidingimonas lacisalsi]|uniref:glycosyltransferase family 4 protein n=1 Tax=Aidingimonas lacisalsi TaxID=2604086 RepID=UPI00191C5B38|nr:glycosyltransferase family 4 protein [Aidingimonas lacisalsi]
MRKKVLLLSKYSRQGASSRLRSLQYLPYLDKYGFDVTVQSLFDDKYLKHIYQGEAISNFSCFKYSWNRLVTLFGVFKYDLIWIEYEVFPYFFPIVERLLNLFGKAYVVDYDDAVFHNYDLSSNALVKRCLGGKIDDVMRHAGCVIVGNRYLAARARRARASQIAVIPTVVDHGRYVARKSTAPERPVIGWIGSPSTQKYVVAMGEVLRRVCRETRARLMLVGASPAVAEELLGIDVEVLDWHEASEAELIRQMDIGIMPIPDGLWEKGKCGYKLIQYMACAVPVVASPVGANIDIVKGSRAGLLADSPEEWERALTQLLESPRLRQRIGHAGRRAVESTYSLHVQAPILGKVFAKAIKDRGARTSVSHLLQ